MPTDPKTRGRILVADDDSNLLELLVLDLRRQGYEVLTAADGRIALQMALAEPPDLILLDVMMPHVDGYHVASELIDKLGPRAPRIMIMTSRDTVREKNIALMSGAAEVLQKPFELQLLHERVAALLAKPAPKI